ncbi:hypothetical protein ECEC1865_0010, partial [Escherichia coli EC1865]
MAGITPRRCT